MATQHPRNAPDTVAEMALMHVDSSELSTARLCRAGLTTTYPQRAGLKPILIRFS
jgi:hypothetical protein